MNLLETITWTDNLKRVVQDYPSCVRSSNWKEIVRLANGGKLEAAKSLAAKGEVNPAVYRRNVMARRMRIERVALFQRIARGEQALRGILKIFTDNVGGAIGTKGHDPKNAKRLYEILHTEAVYMRSSMRVWFNALIKDSARMGFKHAGEAVTAMVKPAHEAWKDKSPIIFKHLMQDVNQEANWMADKLLFEAKLAYGLNVALTKGAKAKIDKNVVADRTSKIFKAITKKNMAGLNPSDKIWDLTTQAEKDMKSIIANGIGNGDNPAVIARKIQKYTTPGKTSDLGVTAGRGLYKSPYRNAMRLARTEMNKTYAKATAQFGKDKAWIQGMMITLSPQHDEDDLCNSYAGTVVSSDKFAELVPFHPHCMCYGTYVIDPKYLGEEE